MDHVTDSNRAVGRLFRSGERGMTLIEIMVVVAIIGLVMGGVGVVAFNSFKRAQVKEAQNEIRSLKHAIQMWATDNSGETCPKTLQELYAGKYINKTPKDPWGQDFVYACPSQAANDDGFDIGSKGPDRQPGTDDDIRGDKL